MSGPRLLVTQTGQGNAVSISLIALQSFMMISTSRYLRWKHLHGRQGPIPGERAQQTHQLLHFHQTDMRRASGDRVTAHMHTSCCLQFLSLSIICPSQCDPADEAFLRFVRKGKYENIRLGSISKREKNNNVYPLVQLDLLYKPTHPYQEWTQNLPWELIPCICNQMLFFSE